VCLQKVAHQIDSTRASVVPAGVAPHFLTFGPKNRREFLANLNWSSPEKVVHLYS
jgi:hypothetical protein